MTTMHFPLRSVIIAAPAGIQRDALVSLLRAQPRLVVAAVTNDLGDVRSSALAGRVQIIVLDGELQTNAALALVAWLRQTCPGLRCVVLAGSTARRKEFLQAGAHEALLKGCLDDHLLAALSDRQ